MDNDLELTLIHCLDALAAGEPVEAILARHPADAAALRPLLEAAVALAALDVAPSSGAQAASRRAFLNQAAARRPAPRRSLFGLPARLGLLLATLLLALLLAGGTALASATALPGDPLYGLKRSVERVELALARNPEAAADRIAERRRAEVGRLVAASREADVQFEGVITAVGASRVQVGMVTVALDAGTKLEGEPRIGARAEVVGRTDGSGVRATVLRVEPGAPPPAPSATATSAATATATAAPTRTPPPPTATRTATPRPTLTATAEPTATSAPTPRPAPPTAVAPTAPPPPPPAPTAPPPQPQPTAVPDDNSNDNDGGENDNSNGNDGGGDSGGGGSSGGGEDDRSDRADD